LLTLQNDAAKNSLYRSTAVNIPINSSSAATQNKGKAPMPMPSYKRSHGIIGQSSHNNQNSFRGNGSKGAAASKLNWGHPKDAKAVFKSPFKSFNSDQKIKYEEATSGFKIYDSWNKDKAKLTEDEFNKRRRNNACGRQ